MYIQQVIEQVTELFLGDAAGVKVEVLAEDVAHLLGTAVTGITVPRAILAAIQCVADDGNIGSDHGTHIIAGAYRYLLGGQDDGNFGMAGTHYTHGFRPPNVTGYYIASVFFFESLSLTRTVFTIFLNFVIRIKVI